MEETPLTPWQQYKKNLGTTKPWDVINNKNKISDQEAELRFSICEECESLIKITNQCKECGCFMKLKTKLQNAVCPLGKW